MSFLAEEITARSFDKHAANIVKYTGNAGKSTAKEPSGLLGKAWGKVRDYFGNPMVSESIEYAPSKIYKVPKGNDEFLELQGPNSQRYRGMIEDAILKNLVGSEKVIVRQNRFVGGYTKTKVEDAFRDAIGSKKTPGMGDMLGISAPKQAYAQEMSDFLRRMKKHTTGKSEATEQFRDTTGVVARAMKDNTTRAERTKFHPDILMHNTTYSAGEKKILSDAFTAGVFNVSNKSKVARGTHDDVFDEISNMSSKKGVNRDRYKAQARAAQMYPDSLEFSKNKFRYETGNLAAMEKELADLKAYKKPSSSPDAGGLPGGLGAALRKLRKELDDSGSRFHDYDRGRKIEDLQSSIRERKSNMSGDYNDITPELLDKLEKQMRWKRYGRNTAIGVTGVGGTAYGLNAAFGNNKKKRKGMRKTSSAYTGFHPGPSYTEPHAHKTKEEYDTGTHKTRYDDSTDIGYDKSVAERNEELKSKFYKKSSIGLAPMRSSFKSISKGMNVVKQPTKLSPMENITSLKPKPIPKPGVRI